MGVGLVLGILNVFVSSLIIMIWSRDAVPLASAVVIGLVPGAVTGGLLGVLARALATSPVWARRASLIVLAELALVLLLWIDGINQLIEILSVPTAAAALILEKMTRRSLPPRVPPARAVRS